MCDMFFHWENYAVLFIKQDLYTHADLMRH